MGARDDDLTHADQLYASLSSMSGAERQLAVQTVVPLYEAHLSAPDIVRSVLNGMRMYQLAKCHDQLGSGRRRVNLQRAVHWHHAAGRILTKLESPREWAANHYYIGRALIEVASSQASCMHAMRHYRAGLSVIRKEDNPIAFALFAVEMAEAWRLMSGGNRVQNLTRAIRWYRRARRASRPEIDLQTWSIATTNLANLYRDLAATSQPSALGKALRRYDEVLGRLNERTLPSLWAVALFNKGRALEERREADSELAQKAAIACYSKALMVLSPSILPREWSTCTRRLARLYYSTGRRGRREAIDLLDAFARAAVVLTPAERGDIAELASLCRAQRAFELTDRADQNEALRLSAEAITVADDALGFTTEATEPHRFAALMYAKGLAHVAQTRHGISTAEDLARRALGSALKSFDSAGLVAERVAVVTALAALDAEWGNVESAVRGATAILDGATGQDNPEVVTHLRNAALLHGRAGQKRQALPFWLKAVEAADRLLAVRTLPSRAGMEGTAYDLYERAIRCACDVEEWSTAAELSARAKGRDQFLDLWRLTTRPDAVSDQRWTEYAMLSHAADRAEEALTPRRFAEEWWAPPKPIASPPEEAPNNPSRSLEQLAGMRERLSESDREFRRTDPGWGRPLRVPEIGELAARLDAVIIEFRVTTRGCYVFVIGPGQESLGPEHVLDLVDTDIGTVEAMVLPLSLESVGYSVLDLNNPFNSLEKKLGHEGGYHRAFLDLFSSHWAQHYSFYRAGQLDVSRWLAFIEWALSSLNDLLMFWVRDCLRQHFQDAKRLVLIPCEQLNVMPLHAASWRELGSSDSSYLLDSYSIAYAPSCWALQQCLKRRRPIRTAPRTLLAVGDPERGDPARALPFATWEIDRARRFFDPDCFLELSGNTATAPAILSKLGAGYSDLLFACHGVFDYLNPRDSALQLAGGVGLTARQLLTTDMHGSRLAILSACETAAANMRDCHNTFQGLPSGFLAAGVRTVVGTQWMVGDLASALLIDRFIANTFEGGSEMADSLRDAQTWLRRLTWTDLDALIGEPGLDALRARAARVTEVAGLSAQMSGNLPFAHPNWWAPFQCIGVGWNER
jgi:CHAT domain-containing protein/tetratricopeptide (TPR) repeat protein